MKKYFFLLILISNTLKAQYYSSALGLTGIPLKNALHTIIKNHTSLSWPLWTHFSNIDIKTNGKIWDIYSDIPGGIPPYEFTPNLQQCGTYNSEADCYNHEHSWPDSYYNGNSSMHSDLFHLYPTDGWVNNQRSNLPYGKVSSPSWTSLNGSKIGTSTTYIGYSGDVFEPIDSFKGDLARSYFYMCTRYQGEDAGWQNWIMANGAQLTPDAITLLLTWHHNDPVSSKEKARNNAIYNLQHNRNPFIDSPIFVDCIWGTANCAGLGINTFALEKNIQFIPNPVYNTFSVLNSNHLIIQKIVCYNVVGIKEFETTSSTNIPMNTLTNGIYTIQLFTDKGTIYKKLLKL